MSNKKNAFDLTGFDNLACAIWMEGRYMDFWKKFHDELNAQRERDGEDLVAWEDFREEEIQHSEIRRKGFLGMMSFISP